MTFEVMFFYTNFKKKEYSDNMYVYLLEME